MPHVLIAGKIHPAGVGLIKQAPGFTHRYVTAPDVKAYIEHIAEADAIILRTQPLSAATIAQAPKLRLVSRHGVGYDAVDTAALAARAIQLCIVGDVNSSSVAEHTLLLLLAAARRLREALQTPAADNWQWRNRFSAGELQGKNLLILGYGRIGRRVAQLAAAFGMRVLIHDPYVSSVESPEFELAPDLRAALPRADALSVHVPAPAGGGALLGAAELNLMRAGAIVVNSARGGLIDEAALAAALQSGHIAAAGLDVLADEPPHPDNPLLGLENVVITPHSAGLTAECAQRMACAAAQNVLDFFAGKLDPKLLVSWSS